MVSTATYFDSYPFIAPEKYAGKLNGKTVIITGSSSGIGRETAKQLAKAGASIACVARREPELTTLVEEITFAGGKAIAVVADIAAKGAAKHIVSQTESAFGPIDIVVNNAGIARISPLDVEEDDLDLWWRVYEVNVRGPVSLIRAVLPGMIQRKSGIVITVSSGVATMALPVMTAYASSKAAISKFHESLTPELKATGVYSYAVCPGMVDTELGQPTDAINKAHVQHPAMQAFIKSVGSDSKKGTVRLPADTIVAVAADERFRVLNGHHFSAEEDLETIVKEAEKPEKGRIGKERLYLVNIGRVQ